MPKNSITIASLDVGRFYTGNSLSIMRFIVDLRWDVICLHGLPEYVVRDGAFKKRWPIGEFRSLTRHFMQGGVGCHVGNGIFSREMPFRSVTAAAYVGAVVPVRSLDPNSVTIAPDGNANARDYRLLEKSESRLAVFATIEVNGAPLTIGTTDMPWRPVGMTLDGDLRASLARLAAAIGRQERPLVIAGGFRTRESDVHQFLLEEVRRHSLTLHDPTPPHIVNTVDWKSRGTEGPDLVVDFFLTTGVEVSEMSVHPDLSKNFGVSATFAW